LILEWVVRVKVFPGNENTPELPAGYSLWEETKRGVRETRYDGAFFGDLLRNGLKDSTMILRWIFFGTVMAATFRALLTPEQFGTYFGPTMLGLLLTLVATTVIEVCSEGSSPIAADLVTRAGAPGNGFVFLMAGVATDYTEILSIRERTRSWKVALFLPVVTVPQVVVIGWVLNRVGGG
jgi:uncharacterized membrane protein YraQ (UPF0718 family)